ncbi:DUF3696 domain-containing protein [Ectothiorhodospiraceae bacterium BW-2]|nr:DUF3696 domain-containing protein [Ectothiorhodospiraceae bacterium BW-2]
MAIKSITIENFKGIREPVKFELAPITLLYGPNSAGKSTLLQALAYLNDVVNHQECNNRYTRVGGTSMDLGGFANLVHGHDLSRSIKFGIEIDALWNWDLFVESTTGGYMSFVREKRSGKIYFPHEKRPREIPNENAAEEIKNYPLLSANTVTEGLIIEFSISWEEKEKRAFLSHLKFIAKNEVVVTISTEGGNDPDPNWIEINFFHPWFLLENKRYLTKDSRDNIGWKYLFDGIVYEDSLWKNVNKEKILFPGFSKDYVGADVYRNVMLHFFDKLNEISDFLDHPPNKKSVAYEDFDNPDIPSFYYEEVDVEPDVLKNYIDIENRYKEIPIKHKYTNALFYYFFNTLLSGSFEEVSNFLTEAKYIGPLRKVPTQEQIQEQYSHENWHNGIAAWQSLNQLTDENLSIVNQYLCDTDKFNCGYRIKKSKVLALNMEVEGELEKIANGENNIDLPKLIEQINRSGRFQQILKLIDVRRDVEVNVSDVGTGISQIVPIIVGLLSKGSPIFMNEQPELHIHPRLQVILGELIAGKLLDDDEQANNKQQRLFLFETHSEHLLLRLLRRIREPIENGNQLNPKDIAVYYIDTKDGATTAQRLRIDEEGEFIDDWPNGFFEERADELF